MGRKSKAQIQQEKERRMGVFAVIVMLLFVALLVLGTIVVTAITVGVPLVLLFRTFYFAWKKSRADEWDKSVYAAKWKTALSGLVVYILAAIWFLFSGGLTYATSLALWVHDTFADFKPFGFKGFVEVVHSGYLLSGTGLFLAATVALLVTYLIGMIFRARE